MYIYKFVGCNTNVGLGMNIYTSIDRIPYEITGYNNNLGNRMELIGQPKFKGFLGPMYDGLQDDNPVIRYESHKAYQILSV